MKVTKEQFGNSFFKVHQATAADEEQTIAICRVCGDHVRRYVIDDGVVCTGCLSSFNDTRPLKETDC